MADPRVAATTSPGDGRARETPDDSGFAPTTARARRGLISAGDLLASRGMVSRDDSSDDARLFRDAIGRVRPLKRATAPAPSKPRPRPFAEQSERDEARVRDELLVHAFDPAAIEVGDEIHYLKSGQPQRLLKQLRRGHFSVRAERDLHEMTIAVARDAVRAFLDDCIARGEYCVRIVHGKGLRSRADGPVLKRMTAALLARRKDVLAYASARPAQGGTGAVVVLLARAS